MRKATWGGEKCSVDPRPRLSFFFFVLLQDLFFFCAILPRWMVAKGNTESGNGSPLRVADEERNRRVPFDHTRGGGERSGSSFFRSAGGGEKKETWHLFVTPFGFPKKNPNIIALSILLCIRISNSVLSLCRCVKAFARHTHTPTCYVRKKSCLHWRSPHIREGPFPSFLPPLSLHIKKSPSQVICVLLVRTEEGRVGGGGEKSRSGDGGMAPIEGRRK